MLLALSVSLVECFLVLPAHIIHGAQKKKARARGRTPIFLAHYQAVLSYFLRFRYVAAGTSIILLVLAGGWIGRNLDFIMFPIEAGRLVEIEVDLDPGFSIKASEALNRKIENRLEALPSDEVMSWTARVSPSNIDYVLSLNHLNERKRSVTEIVEELRGDITAVKGLRSVTFEIKAGGPEVGLPIAVRITDGSDAVRTKVADDLVEFLGTLPGVHDVSRDDTQGKGEVSLELDYIWLARHGLTVADIAQTLRIAHEGEIVSTTWFGDERIDIRVNLTKEFRTEDYLLSLKVQNSSGELVPFRAFAHLEKQPGVSGRRHWNAVRSITVSSDLDFDLNTPGAIDDAVSRWFDQSTYPGVAISTGGQIEESEEALHGLAVALIAALLAIYFLLGVLFNSLKQPVLILSVVPFGLLGVGTALSVHGQPLSFTGAIGAIGLIGVIVNGAIVMIHRINRLKMEMPGETPRNIVVAAASNRLRPVVLTVVTTAAGMIPLAYGIGGVDVFMGPMALSLGFGLLLSSPVILLLLPCFYVIMDDLAARAA